MQNGQKKYKILIVDDSEINRSILADMLGEEFECMEAQNGVEAIAALHAHESGIALVLLDIVMPEMDGFEVLEVMNKSHWIDLIPVIMISSEMTPSYVDRAFDLGAVDYIGRPFDGRIVRRRVMNTLMLYKKQKQLTGLMADQVYEQERSSHVLIELLSSLVEFRNGESGLHALHIQVITDMLLERLVQHTDRYQLSRLDISRISNASALHDIGKLSVPENILNKPEKLTPEEFEVMKQHCAEGADILENIPLHKNDPLIRTGYQICRWHHERYDGGGYPDGLKGDEIPIAVQAVSVAEVYDALCSQRAYRPAYSHQEAMEMIQSGACGAFNPLLLKCLTEIEARIEKAQQLSSMGKSAQMEIQKIAEEMIEKDGMKVSDRTLRLLEHERIKFQFFAAMSREVQFEFTVEPDMAVFSEWGAKHLGISEVLMEPMKNPELQRVVSVENLEDFHNRIRQTTPKSPVVQQDYLLNIDGIKRWYKLIARAMWTDDNPPEYTGTIGKFVDIHEEHERMCNLETLAAHDLLTGLLNHSNARAHIEKCLNEGQGKTYALLLLDLDYFKNANDQFGHLFGDSVLKYVAEQIAGSIRSSDLAARVGGDEFLIFMEYNNSAEQQVKRIFRSLTDQYRNFHISISMGVALWPGDASDYEQLFHCADQALYASKRSGKNRFSFFNGTMQDMLSVLSPIESDEPV